MIPPTEDPRKLEITLRHYKEDYASQAVKTAKLQAEIVQLRANVDYLQQCLAEERAQRNSESVSIEQPSRMGGALALNTPPISDRGSIARPVSLEDRIHSIDLTDSPSPLRPSHAIVAYSKKRRIAANRGQSYHRQLSPEEEAGPSNPRKRAKSVVHVLVPPLSAEKRRAFFKAPLSVHEDNHNRHVDPPRAARIKRERYSSIQPLPGRSANVAESRVQQLRSPSRELSYLDPPILASHATNTPRTRSPAPAELSASAHHPPSVRAGLRNDTATQSQGPPRVLRPLPRRSVFLRTRPMVPAPIRPLPRASADGVDRLCDIPSLNVRVSDTLFLDKTASRTQLATILGGQWMKMCVSVNGRHLLYPNHEFQPGRPIKPGEPGLFLYPSPEPQWQGDAQTVFVGLYTAKYRYVGEYTLTAAEPLSSDEFNALLSAAKQKWAGYIAKKKLLKDVRIRIATRRDKRREAVMQEVMVTPNDVKILFKKDVTAEDVLRAYESGEERMHVWRMTCIRFDEAFLRDLVVSL